MKNPRRRASARADLRADQFHQQAQNTAFTPEKQRHQTLATLREGWVARRYPAAGPTARAVASLLFEGETEIGPGELSDAEESALPTLPIPF